MNSRERIMTALAHKEPDRIPFSFGAGKACRFTKGFYTKLLKYLGMEDETEDCPPLSVVLSSDAVLEKLGVDIREAKQQAIIVATGKEKQWEDDKSYFTKNEWGTVLRMPKTGGLCFDLYEAPLAGADEEADDSFLWPSAPRFKLESRKTAEDYQAAGYPVMLVDMFANGFLQTGTQIYGYENWMAMLALEERRVHKFQEKLLERKMKWYDHAFEVYGDAIDIIGETDDLGIQTGPFVSTGMFRKMVLPYHKRLYEYIKKISKVKILLHSCGSVSAYYRDLIDAGVEIINPVQISAADMDPYYLKKEFGKDLSFWGGGVDTQFALPHGNRQEVEDSVKRSIDAFGRDGGFIFGPVHNVQSDVPIENFIVLMETYHKYCKY